MILNDVRSSDGFGDFAGEFEVRDGAPELAGVVSGLEILEQGGELGGLHHGQRARERVVLEEGVRRRHFAAVVGVTVAGAHARASVARPHLQALGAPGPRGRHA